MHFDLKQLWLFKGTVSRRPYVAVGVALGVLKVGIDYTVSAQGFHRAWSPLLYIRPEISSLLLQHGGPAAAYYLDLLVIALPFLWVMMAMSVQRLRSAGLPLWLSLVLLVPLLKYALILLLCVAPPRPEVLESEERVQSERPTRFQKRSKPDNPVLTGLYSIIATDAAALGLAKLSVSVFMHYGMALFIWLPLAAGLASTLLFSIPTRRTFGACSGVAILTGLIGVLLLMAVNAEGAVCLLMAFPLEIIPCLVGALIGYTIQNSRWDRRRSLPIVLSLLMIVPALMGAESALQPAAPVYAVTSSVVVNAPPEVVWRNVISFPPLPPPTDLLFQSGIAYPLRAEIRGRGPHAIRYCVFSTGAFVEPIRVWDEPQLLRFAVTRNPPPMVEWSLYGALDSPHLHGFMMSRQGQFLLTALPGGRTRLSGTTWYQHHLWPAPYWRYFSDGIVHQIHLSVLEHIKRLSENRPSGASRSA